jgi:hypothetical protein
MWGEKKQAHRRSSSRWGVSLIGESVSEASLKAHSTSHFISVRPKAVLDSLVPDLEEKIESPEEAIVATKKTGVSTTATNLQSDRPGLVGCNFEVAR